jgi:hypothetical protein
MFGQAKSLRFGSLLIQKVARALEIWRQTVPRKQSTAIPRRHYVPKAVVQILGKSAAFPSRQGLQKASRLQRAWREEGRHQAQQRAAQVPINMGLDCPRVHPNQAGQTWLPALFGWGTDQPSPICFLMLPIV